jgi:transcriptional regulator with XRE-family HTH domain
LRCDRTGQNRAVQPESPTPPPSPRDPAPEDRIGERIAQQRMLKQLTHDGLAKLTKLYDVARSTEAGTDPGGSPKRVAGISRTTIRGYEIGMYKPGTREIRLLSQCLEVSPTWLIFGGDDEAPNTLKTSPRKSVPQLTELQHFMIALPQMRHLARHERQLVYDMVNTLAQHRMGEAEHRALVISMEELGGVFGDLWFDFRETGKMPEGDEFQEYIKAHEMHIKDLIGSELGDLLKGAVRPPGSQSDPAAAAPGVPPPSEANPSSGLKPAG